MPLKNWQVEPTIINHTTVNDAITLTLLGPFHEAIAVPLSRVVVVIVVVVVIDAQAARDSTTSDTWWMGVRRVAVANGPNIF